MSARKKYAMSNSRELCFRGLQKTSVIDFPGKVACVFFAGGCNFRCPFCHNTSLVNKSAPEVPWDTVWSFLRRRQNVLQGVVVSGGEPTLVPFLDDFLAKVRDMGLATKLDTNGYAPVVLEDLLNKNLLDFVAMDVKNSPRRYGESCGMDLVDLNSILRSVNLLKNSGIAYELRTTVSDELHTVEDIREMAEFLKGGKRYALQPLNPGATLSGRAFTPPNEQTLKQMAAVMEEGFEQVLVRK